MLCLESPRASQSETGSEGASTKTRELPEEPPHLGMYNNLQGAQNQDARLPQNEPSTFVGCRGPPPNPALHVNASQAPSLHPRKRYTSVTLQDARLLVEAMSSSVSSQQEMLVEPVCGPSGALQTADRALADLQILPHSSENPKAVHSLLIKEFAAAETSQESVHVTQPSEAESQVRVSSAGTSAAEQPRGSSALKTSAPSKEGKRLPPAIMIMPRLSVSLENCDRATQCPTLVSAAATKVVSAKNTGKVQTTAAPDLTHGGLSTSSVPVKTPFDSSNKSLAATEPTIFGEVPSGAHHHPTIKRVIPAQQTVVLVPESDKSDERADRFPSQELKLSLESPSPPDVVPSVSQMQEEDSQSCFSLNSLAGLNLPAACHIKSFAVVRLTRLPFLMSMEESVLISRLSLSVDRDSHSVLNQDTGSSRPSSVPPPVITSNNSGASSPACSPANLPQNEVTWETLQPLKEKKSSKDQEKVHQFSSLCVCVYCLDSFFPIK